MSISSEITRIRGNIANAYTAVSGKGGTLPTARNSANLPAAIASIPSGGGGVPSGYSAIAAGSFTPTADTETFTATHNMGVEPDVVFVYMELDDTMDMRSNPDTIMFAFTLNKTMTFRFDTPIVGFRKPLFGCLVRSFGQFLIFNNQNNCSYTATDFTVTSHGSMNVCYFAAARTYRWIAVKYATT